MAYLSVLTDDGVLWQRVWSVTADGEQAYVWQTIAGPDRMAIADGPVD
jgi:hypothetical protein